MPSSPSTGQAPRHPPGSGGGGTPAVQRYDNIVKSQEDKREYRGLVLPNRLKVLLISDPTTDKAAAAIDVNVGYLSDPEHLPGLAHFCEHMLFLGTKKYPEENEYSKFLSEHGGSSNASTSSDHTTYYFDILPEHLPKALDIFAQFFLEPLFTESATGRELSAVNSEHDKNRSSDTWRLDQLNKSTAAPDHPYHKFGTGNKDTLETIPKAKGIDVRAELLKFHGTWYSSNIMTLAVFGKESLDELEALVTRLFSDIKDLSVESPTWETHPFPPERRRKRAYCVPVKDLRSLSIDFPIPDSRKHYKSAPGHYLSHLLGHEGPGSLLSALKARGWCNGLVGGTRVGGRGFGFFGVQVDLTEDGVEHIDDIVTLLFQYISMLREQKPQRWIWEEQRDLMAMDFRFRDTQEPRSCVTGHVHLMQEFPMRDILSAYFLVTEWKPELIDQLLSLLTPENVRVGIVAKGFADKCTMTEEWYGTKYLQEDIAVEQIEIWRSAAPIPELHLPPPNEYIPSRLDLLPSPPTATTAPAIVRDTPLMRLWYKLDTEFQLPKAVITFDLVSGLAYADPLNCNMTSVWVLLLRDALQEMAYASELAGLRWSIGNAKYGLSVTVDGFDDKQHVLLEKIIDAIVNFKTDPARFAIMKESHIRSIRNFDAEQPYQHAVYQQAMCLSDQLWTKCQLLDAAEAMTPELIDDFASRFIRKVHVEGMIMGNVTRERALEIAQRIESKLPKDATPLLAQQLMLYREVELDKGASYLRVVNNSVHTSSCACVYYSCGVRAHRDNVSLELLAQILSEPCFTQLRTKEQLGYIVFSGPRRSNGVQGLRVIVQGERHPAHLEERIDALLATMEAYISDMAESEFVRHRSALAAQRLERPKRLAAKAGQLWGEITAQVYNFDRARVEVEQLQTITKEELLQFYQVTLITDLIEFKSRRKLYPQPTPYINIPRKGQQCKL